MLKTSRRPLWLADSGIWLAAVELGGGVRVAGCCGAGGKVGGAASGPEDVHAVMHTAIVATVATRRTVVRNPIEPPVRTDSLSRWKRPDGQIQAGNPHIAAKGEGRRPPVDNPLTAESPSSRRSVLNQRPIRVFWSQLL